MEVQQLKQCVQNVVCHFVQVMSLDIGDVPLEDSAETFSKIMNGLIKINSTGDETLIEESIVSMNKLWEKIDHIFSIEFYNKELLDLMRKKQLDTLK